MFKFTDRKILVTGATGGIGAAIARAFHQMGATVTISGRRTEALKDLAKELGDKRVHLCPCDLANNEHVEKLIATAETLMGGVDTLVNNAGITKDMLMLRMKDEDFDEVLRVNLRSAFILSRAALKGMMKERFGRIINISSIVGVTGNPGQANYVASKAGLIGLSKSLAQEVASRNITVNCIAPGFIASAMTDILSEDLKGKLEASIPMKHIGAPEDIAAAAVYLASKEAGYVTGQTIHVNGGMAMI